MKKKYFLVIGSNSFSGSNLINFLLNKKRNVIAVSRSKEINKVYLPYKKSKYLDLLKFYKVDLNKDINKMSKILKKFKPQYIINYAAQGMVAQSWLSPEDWYNTNIVGQVRLIQVLKECKFIKKYIHVTTPEVYGSTNNKIKENFNFNPSTPYAISRATTDTHLKRYFEEFNFPVIFTRTANVYGPGQQLYRIVPKAILFSKLKKKFPLHGGGRSIRSFIFIEDASYATYKIALKGQIGQTYHISTNKIISIKNLVKKIFLKNKKNLKNFILNSKDRTGKDHTYNLNSEKIRSRLGWKPLYSLEDGIIETEKWVQNNFEILKKIKIEYIHKK